MTTTATGTTMIAAFEIWTPDKGGEGYDLSHGWQSEGYSILPGGPHRSAGTSFIDQAFTLGEPQVLKELDAEWEARSVASIDGLAGALAIPVADGVNVRAVLVIFMESSGTGALEVWSGHAKEHELSLKSALYPGLDRFGRISEHVHFPAGSGLPGRAWQQAAPQLQAELGSAAGFLRSSSAAGEGLDTGLALPIINGSDLRGVVLALSAERSPLFKLWELWRPVGGDSGSSTMTRVQGHHHNLHETFAEGGRAQLAPGIELVGQTWALRKPSLVTIANAGAEQFSRYASAQTEGLTAVLAFPILVRNDVRAVVVWGV